MRFQSRIIVKLKPTIKDNKANVLCNILQRNKYEQYPKISCGNYYELETTALDEFEAVKHIVKICDEVLSNNVIEEYTILSVEVLQ